MADLGFSVFGAHKNITKNRKLGAKEAAVIAEAAETQD
jgi:hypothetical protein